MDRNRTIRIIVYSNNGATNCSLLITTNPLLSCFKFHILVYRLSVVSHACLYIQNRIETSQNSKLTFDWIKLGQAWQLI